RDDGQGRTLRVAELPQDQLALHLEPDHEEEERHQAVVDPVMERVTHLQVPDLEADLGLPEMAVGFRERGVGEYQRDHRAREQDDPARRLDVEKALDGLDQTIDRLVGQAQRRSSALLRHAIRRSAPGRLRELTAEALRAHLAAAAVAGGARLPLETFPALARVQPR